MSICLNWIADNRSRLNRLDSEFENEVKIQSCVSLIRHNRQKEAIIQAKTFFSKLPHSKWKNHRHLLNVSFIKFSYNF